MSWLLLPAAVVVLAGTLLAQSEKSVEDRVEALLARMNLDEKIGQMSQSTAMATPMSTRSKPRSAPGDGAPF